VAALDELHELVHDRSRRRDLRVISLDRQLVASQPQGAVETGAERVEDAVTHAGELGRDLVRNGERFLHAAQCRRRIARKVLRRKKTPIQNVIEIGQELASMYPWVDVEELERDDVFEQLVDLLSDPENRR
jgi:hypothetical protein